MSALSALMPVLEPERDPRGLGALVALVSGAEVALPLEHVQVRAEVVGGCARTVIEQRYRNAMATPLEAVHRFPLPFGGALVDLVLRCGDLEVRADIQEKAAAQATFAAAREAGHRAALLTQERDDVHTLRITRLPPGEAVTVRLEVVEFLDFVDGAWRYRFPTTIAPRYLPGNAVGHAGDGTLPDTDHVPDASHLQPPVRLAGGTRLDLEVRVRGPVHGVESALHAMSLRLVGGDLRLAPSGKATLDRDVVFAIIPGDGTGIETRAYTDGQHTLVQVAPPPTGAPEALPRDAVFVVDISGSMEGTKMTAAKSALVAALHGLLPGDRFSLIAFDDRIERFAPELVAYDARSLAKADRWIADLEARGGTEMLPAIQTALAGETPTGRLRTVLFITDGQAWNTQELVAAVANRRGRSLFFTLGIDTAVNGALLTQLARVGGGTCELATPNDDIEAVVARLEARFGAPLATELRVSGREDAALLPGVLFAGRPAVLLVEGAPERITVNGEGAGLPATAAVTRIDFPVGALYARRRIAALEDRLVLKPFEEEALRPELVRISLAQRVVCRFTAFVAVERSRVVEGTLSTLQQPNELPDQWSESFAAPPGGGGGGAPASQGVPMPAMAPAPMPSRPAPDRARAITVPTGAPPPAPPPPPAAAPKGGNRGGALGALGALVSKVASAVRAAPEPPFEGAADGFGGHGAGGIGGRLREAEESTGAFAAVSVADRDEAPAELAADFGPADPAVGDFESAEDEACDDQPAVAPVLAFKRAAPAMGRASEREDKAKKAEVAAPEGEEPGAWLARTQGADGSYGGDAARTAAALLALVLGGHTRRKGLRRRTVAKAAAWLAAQGGPEATLALAVLDAAEAGTPPSPTPAWAALHAAAAEGALLARLS